MRFAPLLIAVFGVVLIVIGIHGSGSSLCQVITNKPCPSLQYTPVVAGQTPPANPAQKQILKNAGCCLTIPPDPNCPCPGGGSGPLYAIRSGAI